MADKCGTKPFMENNCPIRERTGDNTPVGRCCFHLKNGVCERHGDVSYYQQRYKEEGRLTDEVELVIRRLFYKALEGFVGKDLPEEIVLTNPMPGILKARIDTRTGDTALQLETPAELIKITVEV